MAVYLLDPGGEPLAHRQVLETIAIPRGRGGRCVLVTNNAA